ncbi:MAG: hypothetical protein RL754_168 [Bacteroidota bacterium]|jgi:hypothetical protein
MKKFFALSALASAFALASCEPNGPAEEPAVYPSDSLTVAGVSRPLVVETTGAWCQYCPNGAEIMTILDGVLGDSAVLIANHVGDYFSQDNVASAKFDDNFPTSGVPNFYVNNTDVGQNPAAAAAAATMAEVAFDVITEAHKVDGVIRVFPRVKCLQTSLDQSYMIQSYLLLSGVEARDYGNGVDLNQVSSVPIVSTGSGTTPSTWAQDAAEVAGVHLIKAGTIYTHNEVLFRHATTAVTGWYESPDNKDTTHTALGPWGMSLGDINPLGNSFASGDIFGTRYNAFQFEIAEPQGLPFTPDYSVATIVWKLRDDGSGDYDYVNGHVAHVE